MGTNVAALKTASAGTGVILDAQGVVENNAHLGATTVNYTGITVGSVTHGALVLAVEFNLKLVSAITAVWDAGGTNQSMTEIGHQASSATPYGLVYLFGLVAPTAGNKTLTMSWTTNSEFGMNAISFGNVDQTGGGTSFANVVTADLTGTIPTVIVTSNSNDAVVGVFSLGNNVNNIGAPDNTQLMFDNAGAVGYAANWATGAASVILSCTAGANAPYAAIGCDIVAG